MNNDEFRCVSYNRNHMDIVTKGIDAITAILNGTDMKEKEALIFCLDRYLDPWYGYKLPYTQEIFELLQRVVISPNIKVVKEDALNLLTSYSYPPFTILEENLDKIEPNLLEDVQYAINMDDCSE